MAGGVRGLTAPHHAPRPLPFAVPVPATFPLGPSVRFLVENAGPLEFGAVRYA